MATISGDLVGIGLRSEPPRGFGIAKYVYTVCFLISAVATWIVRDYSEEWFGADIKAFTYCKDARLTDLCTGKQVALRLSLGNFLFFAFHLVLMLGTRSTEDPRSSLHSGFWLWKLLLWVGSLVGSFFIPSKSIFTYGEVARFGSGLFLIFQVIELINFIYVVNEYLLEKDNALSKIGLVLGSLFTWCLGFALVGLAYHFYVPAATECRLNTFFITWSIIAGLFMVAVLFVRGHAETAGLLTSGSTFAYCSYVLVSALNSQPQGSKCAATTSTSQSGWIQVIAIVLALLAICYSTLSTSTGTLFNTDPDDSDPDALPYRPDFFHLVFALASMYMAMLFTNWEVSSSATKFVLDRGWKSLWVKMGSKWLCEAVYIWTVVAPAIFGGRDFK